MQFFRPSLLFMALATAIAALPAPDTSTSPSTEAASGMYERAASLATFSTNTCSAGQADVTVRDGTCFGLPGQGIDVWWTEGDCRVWFAHDSNCQNWAFKADKYTCYNAKDLYSYQVYCG